MRFQACFGHDLGAFPGISAAPVVIVGESHALMQWYVEPYALKASANESRAVAQLTHSFGY
jgi:hypothetical protein